MIYRLLMAQGGSGFTVLESPSAPFSVTAQPYGGWTQIPEAHGLWYLGHLYVGFVDGSNGDVDVVVRPDGEATDSPIVLKAALNTPADSHDAPGLLVMDDGHLIAVYSAHNGGTVWCRISTNTLDSDPTIAGGFGSEIVIVTGGAYTYPQVIQRLAETNVPIYVFIRAGSGTGTTMVYYKSSDHGATWAAGAAGPVWDSDGASYWKIATDGQWRIDFICTDGNPADPTSSIYHFYADDEDYKASDGTPIGDPPHSPSDATLVYDSSDGPGWPTAAALDADGNPIFVFNADNGALTDSSFYYAECDSGGTWTITTILASVGFGVDDPSPVASVDHERIGQVHLVRYISGHHELWRYTKSGGSWSGVAITSGSSVDNLYPTAIKDHPAGLAVLWLAGTYVGAETDFDLGIMATG